MHRAPCQEEGNSGKIFRLPFTCTEHMRSVCENGGVLSYRAKGGPGENRLRATSAYDVVGPDESTRINATAAPALSKKATALARS